MELKDLYKYAYAFPPESILEWLEENARLCWEAKKAIYRKEH